MLYRGRVPKTSIQSLLVAAFAALSVSACAPAALQGSADRTEVVILSPNPANTSECDVADLRGVALTEIQGQARSASDAPDLAPALRNLRQHSTFTIGAGDFILRATVVFDEANGRGAGVVFDGGVVRLDDPEWGAVLTGRLFGGGTFPLETERPASARPGAPIEVEIERRDGTLTVRLNEFEMGSLGIKGFALGRIGFDLAGGGMRVLECRVEGDVSKLERPLALFTAADGDIDEFRDPSVASDGAQAIVSAIAVSTAEDGSTQTALHVRRVSTTGLPSPAAIVDTLGASVDLAVLGFRRGDARPWKLLIQEVTPQRLVEKLVALDSADGSVFSKVAEVESTADGASAPLQLVAGAIRTLADGRMVAGATRLVGRSVRACVVTLDTADHWMVSELDAQPACDPIWMTDSTVLLRVPREGTRELLHDSVRTPAAGLTGGSAIAASITAVGGSVKLARADAAFPYPFDELTSADGGKSWAVSRVLWGGSSGQACAADLGANRLIVFEGGDRARREHVLVLQLPPALPLTPSDAPSSAPAGERARAPKPNP